MLLPQGTHFAVVDGENFELHRNAGTESDPKLEKVSTPSLTSSNYSAGIRDQDDVGSSSGNRQSRLDEAAHAAAVAECLNRQVRDNTISKLVIVADPRSLGEMRKHYHKELEEVLICELDRTMTGHPAGDIVEAVRAAA